MKNKTKLLLLILLSIFFSGCTNKNEVINKNNTINNNPFNTVVTTSTNNIGIPYGININNNLNQNNLNDNIANDNNNLINNTSTNMIEEKNPIVIMKTNYGDIKIELFRNMSPNTVDNFINLVNEGFYNGTKFHRVIKDFMIQGGDPLTKDDTKKDYWGTGGPGYKFNDEINNVKLVRGSFAMANSGPNTNGSQFFIVTADATSWLDGAHTNFGSVIEGLDVVMNIQNIETEAGDIPKNDVIIDEIIIE